MCTLTYPLKTICRTTLLGGVILLIPEMVFAQKFRSTLPAKRTIAPAGTSGVTGNFTAAKQ